MRNRIAIVTGATGGIGREFVKLLLNEDVNEIWSVARNIDKLNKQKEEYGERIIPISADVSREQAFDLLHNMLEERTPIITYLINNAGGGQMGTYNEFSQEEIKSHITTHCTATVTLCNLCIPYMQKGSHIINMASQSAFQPVPYINLYASCKAFVTSYSRALNVELKGTGIISTVACPGWIKTELLEVERNGKKMSFPAMALPEEVALKILRDANKGKDITVYGMYVKYMRLLSKIFPHKLVMRYWIKQIKDFI